MQDDRAFARWQELLKRPEGMQGMKRHSVSSRWADFLRCRLPLLHELVEHDFSGCRSPRLWRAFGKRARSGCIARLALASPIEEIFCASPATQTVSEDGGMSDQGLKSRPGCEIWQREDD